VCDLLCALPAATNGPTLFAKNSDRPPDERQVFEWHPPRDGQGLTRATHVALRWAPPGRTFGVFGSRPTWGWGLEQGVNEVGVAAGNASIYTTLDPRNAPDGLTGMDIVRLVLERGSSAAMAVELIDVLLWTIGQGGSGHARASRPYWSSFLIADQAGTAYVVETTGNEMAVEEVTSTRAISNRTTIPSFDAAHRHPGQPVEERVDPRLRASQHVLSTTPVTVSSLQAHLTSHDGGDDGWTVCMHVDEPGHEEATTAAMVVELPRGAFPVVHHLAGSPCRETWEVFRFDGPGTATVSGASVSAIDRS